MDCRRIAKSIAGNPGEQKDRRAKKQWTAPALAPILGIRGSGRPSFWSSVLSRTLQSSWNGLIFRDCRIMTGCFRPGGAAVSSLGREPQEY
jgi:hypothetical protein